MLNPTLKRLTAILLSCSVCQGTLANSIAVILEPAAGKVPDAKISIAGTFNNWQLDENGAVLMHTSGGKTSATIPKIGDITLFNIYKDFNWQNPLSTEYGKPFTCGFIVDNDETDNLSIDFRGWAQEATQLKPKDTVVGKLETIKDFPMPQLGRSGDIFVHLPSSYGTDPKRSYPVVYMLDGQNLFSEATSYSYEWRVDEIVESEGMQLIVVGIANGPDRWQEYNPWNTVNFMGDKIEGTGKQSLNFIRENLKPYIDSKYRTLADPAHTALLGSSLGGLMALYAAIEAPETFGKVGAFSPAFSFRSLEGQNSLSAEDSNLLNAIKKLSATNAEKIYFDIGEVEYGSFDLIETLHTELKNAGYGTSQLKLVRDKMGRHCELDWSRRLPSALSWLMAGS